MVNLLYGDCMELLKTIPDKTVDLVVTDPPYEFDTGGGAGCFGSDRESYHAEYMALYHGGGGQNRTVDNEVRLRNEIKFVSKGFDFSVLDELERIMKKTNIYIWCSKAQVRKILDYYESRKCNTDILTWHKTNVIPTCNNTYLSDTEYCIFAREPGVKVYGNYDTKRKWYVTGINTEDKREYGHPTIKPLHIIENLIVNSSVEGDTVLDPFMGSGTTGVACINTRRNFIGMEIEEKFYKIAQRRCNETEQPLF